MSSNKSLLIVLLYGCITFLFPLRSVRATHLAGVDLTYTCLGGNQYQVEVTWYRDCAGIAAPTSETVTVSSASRNQTLTLNLSRVPGTGQEITVPCNTAATTCSGGTVPGIQKWVYRGTITLPGAATDWVFSVRRNARNNAITNVNLSTNSQGATYNPGVNGPYIYVEARLNNVAAPCNSSPRFSNDPILFLCANQLFTYNQGTLDPNNDSLMYQLVPPMDAANATLVYYSPFSYTYPLTANPPLTIDPQTGDITVRPTQIEVTVFAVRINEYRNGVLIGSTMRDLQVYVQPCNNALPSASGINGTSSYSTTACAGSQLCFTINSIDSDASQTVTMTWNGGIPGATFTTSGGARPVGTFCWTPTQANISPNPYVFTVTVQDNACPTNGVQIFSYSILVSGLSVELGSPVNLCASSYTIVPAITNGNPPFTYLWNNNATTSTLVVTTSGTYSVTITDATGCTGSDNVQITLTSFGNQDVLLVSDTVTCSGTPITITAPSGYSQYNWSNGTTTASATFTATGMYYLTVTDQLGCRNIDSVRIGYYQFTEPDLGPDRTVCADQLVSLYPGQYASYLWSTGATTPSITPSVTGTYAVTVTDVNGCTGTDAIRLTINPVPTVNLGPDRVVCSIPVILAVRSMSNQTVQWSTGANTNIISVTTSGVYSVTVTNQFGCQASDTVSITVSSFGISDLISPRDTSICSGASLLLKANAGFVTYVWSTGETTQSIIVSDTGQYTIQALDIYGCQNFDTIDIHFYPSPVVDIGADQAICAGATTTFNAGSGYVAYLWNTGATTAAITVGSAGNYSVTVTDANGCHAADTAHLWINNNPQPDLGPDVSICSEGELLLFLMETYQSYVWSTGATTESITVFASGSYSVTVTDQNGCIGSDEIIVSLYPDPDPNLPPSITLCYGETATLEVDPSIFSTFVWSTGATSFSIQVSVAGLYSVSVTDENGCVGTGQTEVLVSTPITLEFEPSGNCENSAGNILMTVAGGVGPYAYNWVGPGGITYFTEDLINVAPGTYTVSVADSYGCDASGVITLTLTPIVVDAGPDSTTICQGSSVTLQATGAVYYEWLPTVGLSDPNIANPVASPTITTTYTVVGILPGNEVIYNGNFEGGNVGFTSDYVYTTTNLVPERTYAIVTNPNPLHPAFQGNDHTSGNGYFMAVNGAVTPGQRVWCQTVAVQPNTEYRFSTWISTLVTQSPAQLAFSINGQLLGMPITAPANLFEWKQFFTTWNSALNTSAEICIVNQNTVAFGNDFGLDDISFVPVCTASDQITVVVNERPVPELGANDTICTGLSAVLSPGNFTSYIWSTGATSSSISITSAGWYSVTVSDINGCSGSDSLEIFTRDCCFPAGFANVFTTIDNTNNVITQNTVWSGKYFVTVDVYVQNGALLDMTNVDVVFDKGTGMIFQDSARVRATNSVFRTCDLDVSWKGFDFLDASSGLFSECIFKNAETALDIYTTLHLQIRNNEFYNFKEGIVFHSAGNGNYKGSITGNKFISTDDRPTYTDSSGSVLTDFFCIKSYNTVFEGMIAQNQFIRGEQNRNNGIRLYGVYLNTSAVSVTENRFTNLYRALDITGNGGASTFENNIVENTVRSHEDVYALRITNAFSAPLLVEGNKITYASLANSNANQAGIYLADSRGVIFSANTISGFNIGINILRGEFVDVERNTITNAGSHLLLVASSHNVRIVRNRLTKTTGTGILLLDNLGHITVSDNYIDGEDVDNASGIRVVDNDNIFPYNTFTIIGNCIHNTANAMTFESNSGAILTLPVVRNNYLYNYQYHGIWSSSFTGQIGSCTSYPANVGKNSFISNYLSPFGQAVDVRSDNATIVLAGNGPNLVITFPNVLVNTSCNTTATTSCGNQIGNNEWGGRLGGPLSQIDKLRMVIEEHYPLSLVENNYLLEPNFLNWLSQIETSQRFASAKAIMEILRENEDTNEMDKFYDAISSTRLFSGNDPYWLAYHYFLYKNDYQSARANLMAVVPGSADEDDLKQIANIVVNLHEERRAIRYLSADELNILSLIDNKEGRYAAVARDMIQVAMGHHDYQFEQLHVAHPSGEAPDNVVSMNDNFITVYPNPARDNITIGYLTKEEIPHITIRLTNTLGQVMWETPVEFNNGQISLDVSGFASGAYFICLHNQREAIRHVKFIKY